MLRRNCSGASLLRQDFGGPRRPRCGGVASLSQCWLKHGTTSLLIYGITIGVPTRSMLGSGITSRLAARISGQRLPSP